MQTFLNHFRDSLTFCNDIAKMQVINPLENSHVAIDMRNVENSYVF